MSTSIMGEPSAGGRFGEFGGRFVPETLMPACIELERAFREAWADAGFRTELDALLRDYAGRPSPLTECHRLSEQLGVRSCSSGRTSTTPARTRSTTCWARRCSPSGWASAGSWPRRAPASTAWPRPPRRPSSGFDCVVYMGEVDMQRQALNVFRMRLLGAEVRPASSGSRTLKDAVNEAMRDWVATVETSHYCLGSVMGPHPYPWMVRELHRVIGDEAREPVPRAARRRRSRRRRGVRRAAAPTPPASSPGFADTGAELVGVEPAGGAAVGRGVPGVVHGMKSYLMQDEFGQVLEAQSISAGLDYPGVGPEHAHLADIGRATLSPGDRRRGARRLRGAVTNRGHHPGARAGPRAGVGAAGGAGAARAHGADQPVGPGRQGRRPGDGPHRPRRCLSRTRPARRWHRSARGSAAGGPRRRTQAARPVRHRRLRRVARGGPGAGGGRCRRHRGRHPVLRSGDGRARPSRRRRERALAGGATPASILDGAPRRRRRRAARGR